MTKSWITESSRKEAELRARPKALDPKKKVAVRLEEKVLLTNYVWRTKYAPDA